MKQDFHVIDGIRAFAMNCSKHMVLLLGGSAAALAGAGPGVSVAHSAQNRCWIRNVC